MSQTELRIVKSLISIWTQTSHQMWPLRSTFKMNLFSFTSISGETSDAKMKELNQICVLYKQSSEISRIHVFVFSFLWMRWWKVIFNGVQHGYPSSTTSPCPDITGPPSQHTELDQKFIPETKWILLHAHTRHQKTMASAVDLPRTEMARFIHHSTPLFPGWPSASWEGHQSWRGATQRCLDGEL